jgi:serine/threonine protein kinase
MKSNSKSRSSFIRPSKEYPPPKLEKILTMRDYKKFKKIHDISQKYSFGIILGQGAFGLVQKCTLSGTSLEFAIKIIGKDSVSKNQILMNLLENELSILGSQSHPKIISIVDLLEDQNNFYIVSELVEGGELFERLVKVESFTEN